MELNLTSLLGILFFLIFCGWVIVFLFKNYNLAIGFVICSPLLSTIFIPNQPGDTEGFETSYGSYMRIGLLFVAGIAGGIAFFKNKIIENNKISKEYIYLALYALMAISSMVYSIDPKITVIRSVATIFLFCILLGVDNYVTDTQRLEKAINIVVFSLLFCLLVNIVAIVLFQERVWWYKDPSRLMGLWSQPNQMGSFCMIAYPFLFWKAKNSDGIFKVIMQLSISILLILHVLSGSRTSLASGMIGISIWFFVEKKYFKNYLLIVCLMFLVIGFVFVKPSNMVRQGGIDSITSFTGRTDIWSAAATLAKEKFLIGYGYGVNGKIFEDPRFYDPDIEFWSGSVRSSMHNGYLNSIINLGLIGSILLYLSILMPFLKNLRSKYYEYKSLFTSVFIMCILVNFLESIIGSSSNIASIVMLISWSLTIKSLEFCENSNDTLYA